MHPGWILLIVLILVKKANQEQARGANLKLQEKCVDCRLEMPTGDRTIKTDDVFQRPATENNALLLFRKNIVYDWC